MVQIIQCGAIRLGQRVVDRTVPNGNAEAGGIHEQFAAPCLDYPTCDIPVLAQQRGISTADIDEVDILARVHRIFRRRHRGIRFVLIP